MNLSKPKKWRAHRAIAKQQQKREQNHCVFTHSIKVQKGGES